MGDKKITPKEAARQRGNACLFGYAVGLGVGAFLAYGIGKTAGAQEANKLREHYDLIRTVKNLEWEAENRRIVEREAAANGRTD